MQCTFECQRMLKNRFRPQRLISGGRVRTV